MFQQHYDHFFAQLGIHLKMALATCAENRVTARTVSFILYEKRLYFQTDRHFLKSIQIEKNPLVAVCMDTIQIEGVCRKVGHPLDPQNRFFIDLYGACYPDAYKRYSSLSDEMVYQITPTFITLWLYDNGTPYREFFDVSGKKYWTEYYENEVSV